MSSNSTLANTVKDRILEERQNLLDDGAIRSDEQIRKEYAHFQRYFG